MGTVDYMAPEQASDAHAVDIRADIYSLGCTLYKLLTGCAPFSGPKHRNDLQKLLGHVNDTARPVCLLRSDVPPELAAVVERMMAKSPTDRFSTPAEVATAITPFAKGCDLEHLLAEVAAIPPGPVETDGSLIGTAPHLSSAMTGTQPGDRLRLASGELRKVKPAAYAAAAGNIPALAAPTVGLACAAGAAAVVLATIITYIKNGQGTLIVEVDPPDVNVTLDGNQVRLKSPRQEISIRVGEHELVVSKDGFQTHTNSFAISRGGTTEVLARLEPRRPLSRAAPRARQNWVPGGVPSRQYAFGCWCLGRSETR